MGTHRIVWLAILAALVAVGCEQSVPGRTREITPAASGKKAADQSGGKSGKGDDADESASSKDDGEKDEDDKSDADEDEEKDEDGGKDETDEDAQPAKPVSYPLLKFKGAGNTTCDGDNYATQTAAEALMSDTTLTLSTTQAHIDCDGPCEKKANEKLQQDAVGATVYLRLTREAGKALKKSGFDLAPYLVFATQVTKKDGSVMTFDQPLPVFPMPSPEGAYADLASGPKTWRTTARYNGAVFEIQTVVTKLGSGSDSVTLQLQNVIPADRGGNLYEMAPMPAKAVYTIKPSTRTVLQMNSTHLWFGDDNCDGNAESTVLRYGLCEKVKEGKVENFPCG